MKKYKTNFTKEELQNALHSNSGEASAIIEDESKWNAFKTKFESFLKKVKRVPVLGNVIDDITCMVELVESYVKKEYTAIPKGTIVSIVAVLIYLLSPIDIVPDAIPVLGYMDDAALVLLVLSFGVDHDLDKYREVVAKHRISALEKFEDLLASEIQTFLEDMYLAAAIWDKKRIVKLLISSEQQAEMPIECNVKEVNVPLTQFAEYEVESENDIVRSLTRILNSDSIRWVKNAGKKVYLEPDFSEEWNNYIIQEVE